MVFMVWCTDESISYPVIDVINWSFFSPSQPGNILDRLTAERERVERQDKESRELHREYYKLKEQHDELKEKMRFFTKVTFILHTTDAVADFCNQYHFFWEIDDHIIYSLEISRKNQKSVFGIHLRVIFIRA